MAYTNRLQLNFELETREQRVQFVDQYLTQIHFTPNELECEKIANYILWGKNSEGQNGRQEGLELETRRKTWDTQPLESLDALVESPTFNEANLLRSSQTPPQKREHLKFSRSQMRKIANPELLALFEELWHEIDETEFIVSTYEILTEKKTSPIRSELLERLDAETQNSLRERAAHISSFQYLKLKHHLVDLRREQYTLKDSCISPIMPVVDYFYQAPEASPTFEVEFSVLPLGLPSDSTLSRRLWNPDHFPHPREFSDEDLSTLSRLLWRPAPTKRYFDFSNPDHLYALFSMYEDLKDAADRPNLPPESTLREFMRALDTYTALAHLEPICADILTMKIQGKTNQTICDFVNKKYSKIYKPNYISTLYCKKCLAQIAAAALAHREVAENLFFPENFKTCKDCGKTFLRNDQNFVKRSRSSDGFSPRCKACEKIVRDRYKGGSK